MIISINIPDEVVATLADIYGMRPTSARDAQEKVSKRVAERVETDLRILMNDKTLATKLQQAEADAKAEVETQWPRSR